MDTSTLTNQFQRSALATVHIHCGLRKGSGFHFLADDLVVTNLHVIRDGLQSGAAIVVRTEDGATSSATLIPHSTSEPLDFALLEIDPALAMGRTILRPRQESRVDRGTEVVVAGFPHAMADLLVHHAYVAGPFGNAGFHLDGSISRGSSGGPVVDVRDGTVCGIMTSRRFAGSRAAQGARAEALELVAQLEAPMQDGAVGGVNLFEASKAMARGLRILATVSRTNATSGIAIANRIEFVHARCKELGLGDA